MSFRDLLHTWESSERVETTDAEYCVRLSLDDAARLHALADLYPGGSMEQIITDLMSHALSEVVEAMPYEPGERVIRDDEFGDPVYEDRGLTPRFIELTRHHRERLAREQD